MSEIETGPHKKRVVAFFRSMLLVLRETADSFALHECPTRAAGLAFRGLLSLFPLILFLIYITSLFLDSADTQQVLYSYLEQVIPTAAGFVEDVVDQTLEKRGPIGWIGTLGLVASASSLFYALVISLNVIWNGRRRPVWHRTAMAAVSVAGIGLLFIISIALSALATIEIPGREFLDRAWFNRLISVVVTTFLFTFIFYWLPNRRVCKKAALAGGTLAAVLWEAAKFAFALYLTSGLTNYGLVYGSLASLVALMLWAFLSGEILLLGAEFGSALERLYWPGNRLEPDGWNGIRRTPESEKKDGGE
ncbi:MAG: YihY/virulence factor BrkB family protein [Anaerolineales bacterium]|nr:YihY/virulence factor BrkB family protein [Anaerolineales bacterium]